MMTENHTQNVFCVIKQGIERSMEMTREEAIKYIIPAIKNTWNEKICKEIEQALEQQPSEDGMEKHTDRQIYDGCIHLMQKMVDYFQEYLEYLGYDLDKLDEDERFAVKISNMEIVRWLFLFHTRNSGGCSTRDFCEEIGIDDSEVVKFEFERDEE